MKKRNILFLAAYFLLISLGYCQAASEDLPKLIIFHSPACKRCISIKNELMPQIEKEFRGNIVIEYRDITDMENYKFMLALQEKHAVRTKGKIPLFYFQGQFLEVEEEAFLAAELRHLIAKSITLKEESLPDVDLTARFKAFRLPAVISAGLVDGINPCAFTVIVFFLSFLSLQGYRRRQLLVIGLSFICAVFLTYLLIGLGIFGFLYSLKGFWLGQRIANILIGIFSIILGILSVMDFLKFKKTGRTDGLFLQLPQTVKNQIHRVIGLHYRKSDGIEGRVLKPHTFRLLVSAIITGFLVSLLEAVCTGQVYLPTITFVLKNSSMGLAALGYLLLYNTMFIVPLLAVFLLALAGVTSEQFGRFLKKHLLLIKTLMAILFFGLGIFLIWRA